MAFKSSLLSVLPPQVKRNGHHLLPIDPWKSGSRPSRANPLAPFYPNQLDPRKHGRGEMKEVTMAFHHLRHLRPEVLTSINNFLQVLNSTVGPTTNVMLFGSTTDPNSPLHFGSDIDLLVATNPGTTNSLAFKRAVY